MRILRFVAVFCRYRVHQAMRRIVRYKTARDITFACIARVRRTRGGNSNSLEHQPLWKRKVQSTHVQPSHLLKMAILTTAMVQILEPLGGTALLMMQQIQSGCLLFPSENTAYATQSEAPLGDEFPSCTCACTHTCPCTCTCTRTLLL